MLKLAKRVLIEINLNASEALGELHDVYVPENPPGRKPIGICAPSDRVGVKYMNCDPDKIAGIVITDTPIVHGFREAGTDEAPEADMLAENLLEFFQKEIRSGRMPELMPPIQVGIGVVADKVFKMLGNKFQHLTMYTECLQAGTMELIDSGRIDFASTGGLSLQGEKGESFLRDPSRYRNKIIIRPSEITNHPEIIRRLGVIAINNALEADIYGNVNSTHAMGTKLISGIGGSGDFARNARLSIFTTLSTAKNGSISCVVPMCTHVDHPMQDVNIIATEWGVADLRCKSPRQRAVEIIQKTAHPDYRPALMDYFERALSACPNANADIPQMLGEAFSWYERLKSTGTMREKGKSK